MSLETQADCPRTFSIVEMALDGIPYVGTKLLKGIGLSKDGMPERAGSKTAFRRIFNEEYQFVHTSLSNDTGAENFILAQCLKIRSRNGGDRKRVAEGVKDFDGITFRPIRSNVMFHGSNNITAPKPVFGDVAREPRIMIKFKLRHTSAKFNFFTALPPPDRTGHRRQPEVCSWHCWLRACLC
jgi:hypothetical protein